MRIPKPLGTIWRLLGHLDDVTGRIFAPVTAAGVVIAALTFVVAQEWLHLGWGVGIALLPLHLTAVGWFAWEARALRLLRLQRAALPSKNLWDSLTVPYQGMTWGFEGQSMEARCPADSTPLVAIENGVKQATWPGYTGYLSCPFCEKSYKLAGDYGSAQEVALAALKGEVRRRSEP